MPKGTISVEAFPLTGTLLLRMATPFESRCTKPKRSEQPQPQDNNAAPPTQWRRLWHCRRYSSQCVVAIVARRRSTTTLVGEHVVVASRRARKRRRRRRRSDDSNSEDEDRPAQPLSEAAAANAEDERYERRQKRVIWTTTPTTPTKSGGSTLGRNSSRAQTRGRCQVALVDIRLGGQSSIEKICRKES